MITQLKRLRIGFLTFALLMVNYSLLGPCFSAEEGPVPAPAHQVEEKRIGVGKNDAIDHDDEEIALPGLIRSVDDQGTVEVISRVYVPPRKRAFIKFPGFDTYVDIWQVDETLIGAKRRIDTSGAIQVSTLVPEPANAGEFPLRSEGNMRRIHEPSESEGSGSSTTSEESEEKPRHWSAMTGGEVYFVYLTFDDGPRGGTDDVVRILNNHGVLGSFLMMGKHIAGPDTRQWVRDAKNGGHLIGNHSFSHWHNSSNYDPNGRSNTEWAEDFRRNDEALSTTLGIAQQVFIHARLPGKNAWRLSGIDRDDGNSKRVADHIAGMGYQIYGWDLEWESVGGRTIGNPEDIVVDIEDRLVNGKTELPNKLILLTHDVQFRNSTGDDVKLDRFIQLLKDSDLPIQFRRLDTYLSD